MLYDKFVNVREAQDMVEAFPAYQQVLDKAIDDLAVNWQGKVGRRGWWLPSQAIEVWEPRTGGAVFKGWDEVTVPADAADEFSDDGWDEAMETRFWNEE